MGAAGPTLRARRSRSAWCCRTRASTRCSASPSRRAWSWSSPARTGRWPGRKIEMIKEDDEMKPPVGIRKTEKLIDSDKVDILTGPVHSGILMGMRDKVHNSKTILIVSNAGADAISRERCSKWIFRTSFSNWQPCQPMGGWVAKNVSKDVFLTAPNYQAGKDMMNAFKETFVPAGGKVVGEDYPKLGETDYAPYLTKIRQSGAKAVFAFFSGTRRGELREAVRPVRPEAVGQAHRRGLPHRARRAARAGQVRARRDHRPLLHAAARQPDEPALREGLPREVRRQDARRLRLPGLRHRRGHRARAQGGQRQHPGQGQAGRRSSRRWSSTARAAASASIPRRTT